MWSPQSNTWSSCTQCTAIANARDPTAPVYCNTVGVTFAQDPAKFACADGYVFVHDATAGDSCQRMASRYTIDMLALYCFCFLCMFN